ncbi:glycosyltransferase [Solirubrobacter soli]|uniref:glycosyltransferase n=1 Tax=Solirubrobacter soli TaxID=363832 RepID=UPI00040F336D|nr:glycosyltransferase [Solirubrobacter soli]
MAGPDLLFVSYSGLLGGAERVLLDAVTRIERPLVVACPDGPLADALREAGIAHAGVAERPLKVGLAHMAGVAALARDIRRLKPEFVVAWGARAVLAARLESRPWLAVHHDLLPGRAIRAVVKAASKDANGVAAASQAIARQIGKRVTVLHPGVDLDRFTPRPRPDGPPKVLVLGALVAWKRPELALEIAKRLPEAHVTIAGTTLPGDDGGLERRLRAEAGPNVTIAGPIDDVPQALAEHHVLLHCADEEPYGMVLVEALAAGRPVVAPNAGGPREILAEGLYPPGDAAAAADGIERALADPQAGARARRRAEEHFDVRTSTRRLEEAICRAMPSS